MNATKEKLILALIIVMGLCISLAFYAGPFWSFDDVNYVTYAHQMLVGTFNLGESPYAFSYLYPATIALSFAVFGYSAQAAAVPSMVEYLAVIVMVYLIGKRLFSGDVGLIAAFFAAVTPLTFAYATRDVPDTLVAFLATLSIYVFVLANTGKREKSLYFCSGALAALTIYAKYTGFIFILAMVIYSIYSIAAEKQGKKKNKTGTRLSGMVWLLVGIFVLIGIYVITVYLATGSPFGTFTSYSSYQSIGGASIFLYNTEAFIELLVGFEAAPGLFAQAINPEYLIIGPVIIWAIFGLVVCLVRRERRAAGMALLLFGILFYFYFGTLSLHGYVFIQVVYRYLMMIAAPLFILAAYGLFDVYKAITIVFRGRVAAATLLLMIAVTIILNASIYLSTYNYNTAISNATTASASIAQELNGYRNATVYTNNNSSTRFLYLLVGYKNTFHVELMNGGCSNADAGSLALEYYDVPGGQAEVANNVAAFLKWKDGCTLTALKNFSSMGYGNNSYERYWGFDINATLYLIK